LKDVRTVVEDTEICWITASADPYQWVALVNVWQGILLIQDVGYNCTFRQQNQGAPHSHAGKGKQLNPVKPLKT